LVEMYQSKKEELDEKYDGKDGKKSQYENLEFSKKVLKKEMVPFYVELGGESAGDVIAVLKQSDPTLIGCHALTLPADKLRIVSGSGSSDQSGTATTPPLKTEEVPCNLLNNFADDRSQEKIQESVNKCMDDAIAKTGGKKIKSIRTFVDSCASMVRSKGFKSNLELSQNRALAMESAVNSYISGKGYSNVADDPEVNYKGENKDATGKYNGTCGPLPPVGYGMEPNLILPVCEKNGSSLSDVDKREKEMAALRNELGVKCQGDVADKPGYDWLCDKSFPKSASDAKDKKKYEDAYSKHRKAEIRVVVAYEDEPRKTPPTKTLEKTPPSDVAQKPKSVVQCYKPSLSYDTFSKKTTKGTSITIGGPPGGRGGGGGKGKKKVAECPVFDSESGRNSAGEEITLFKFKYWSRHANREGVRAEDTEMGGNYGESDQ
ncbi:MAG: hypothetical protein HYW49_10170, partial [Deltaproteobacteria bacterium]|nr:hypothetical protein [Deltaproteobacteria bacterium]